MCSMACSCTPSPPFLSHSLCLFFGRVDHPLSPHQKLSRTLCMPFTRKQYTFSFYQSAALGLALCVFPVVCVCVYDTKMLVHLSFILSWQLRHTIAWLEEWHTSVGFIRMAIFSVSRQFTRRPTPSCSQQWWASHVLSGTARLHSWPGLRLSLISHNDSPPHCIWRMDIYWIVDTCFLISLQSECFDTKNAASKINESFFSVHVPLVQTSRSVCIAGQGMLKSRRRWREGAWARKRFYRMIPFA